MILDRIFKRLRGDDAHMIEEARRASERSDQIARRVDDQWAEVHWHNRYATLKIRENHISPKIRAAVASRRGEG